MLSDRVFLSAFAVSLFIHTGVIFYNPALNFLPKPNKPEKLEIKYIKRSSEEKQFNQLKKTAGNKAVNREEPFLKIPSEIVTTRINPPQLRGGQGQSGKNEPQAWRGALLFIKPNIKKPDINAVRKKITFPSVGLEKSKNPSYISYYQIVREKIRRTAYQNYTRTEIGEVYLSFIITSTGAIKGVRIVEERSSFSPYLREVTLRSINDASPFPIFPKALDYPELSFNVVVSFEVE